MGVMAGIFTLSAIVERIVCRRFADPETRRRDLEKKSAQPASFIVLFSHLRVGSGKMCKLPARLHSLVVSDKPLWQLSDFFGSDEARRRKPRA